MIETMALLIGLLAPGSQPASQPAAASQPTAQVKMAETPTLHRGAAFAIAEKERVPLSAVVAKADQMNGKTVAVTGEVKSACAKKGCWMILAESDARARITFKDYGFFVPLDSAGSTAIVEGEVQVKTLTDAERKHLAEDAKKPVESIPVHEVRLVATGVELTRVAAK